MSTTSNNGPTDVPSFNHPGVKALYEHDLTIPESIYSAILELDRPTLIQDLEKIIQDAIAWYPVYYASDEGFDEIKQSFIWHALFLLYDLKAEESLPVVLDVLRQEESFFDFYFSDGLTDFFWQIIYVTGQHQLPLLLQFLTEPGNYAYAKTEVSVAILQIALHQPSRKSEVESVYKELLEFFSEPQNEPIIFEDDFVGLAIGDIEDGKFDGLSKELKSFYKLYPEMKAIAGEWEMKKEQLSNKEVYINDMKRPFQTRKEIYDFFHTGEDEADSLIEDIDS